MTVNEHDRMHPLDPTGQYLRLRNEGLTPRRPDDVEPFVERATEYILASREVLDELREWSDPVRIKAVPLGNGRWELDAQRDDARARLAEVERERDRVKDDHDADVIRLVEEINELRYRLEVAAAERDAARTALAEAERERDKGVKRIASLEHYAEALKDIATDADEHAMTLLARVAALEAALRYIVDLDDDLGDNGILDPKYRASVRALLAGSAQESSDG